MATPQSARDRASFTYNAAADLYDAPALGFWDYFGNRTVERLQLREGDRVLDVACGSGASAIPAARVVGSGSVLGVDLAERLLELARAKAARLGLRNIRFECGDMMALNQPNESFDAMICVFGIFFVPDMVAAVREIWRLVKPGGRLAISTWNAGLFEPANSVFWGAIEKVRPDLHKAFNP
jgi:ubiquinone/menaquinone biosynthesis C-methylase UbiE